MYEQSQTSADLRLHALQDVQLTKIIIVQSGMKIDDIKDVKQKSTNFMLFCQKIFFFAN